MTSRLTDERIAEIEARCSNATPGPWASYEYMVLNTGEYSIVVCDSGENGESEKDAEFIAHARTDIPDLLAEVKALKAERGAALEQNAVTMLDSVSYIINGFASGISGEDGKKHFHLGIKCPYCGSHFDNTEDAKDHDGICEVHPAVIRAKKAESQLTQAEAERDALAAELEENRPFLGGVMYAAAEMVSNGMDMTVPLEILMASGDWEEFEAHCNSYDVERFRQAVGEKWVNRLRRKPFSQQRAEKKIRETPHD